MRKKLIVGGICAIVAASFLYFKQEDKTLINYQDVILPQPTVIAKVDDNYQSYLDEFSKRVISRSESDSFKCEITNSGKGGSAYNSQSSKSFKNSIFYIGDNFSNFAQQKEESDVEVSP
jgi:hypothetical protein